MESFEMNLKSENPQLLGQEFAVVVTYDPTEKVQQITVETEDDLTDISLSLTPTQRLAVGNEVALRLPGYVDALTNEVVRQMEESKVDNPDLEIDIAQAQIRDAAIEIQKHLDIVALALTNALRAASGTRHEDALREIDQLVDEAQEELDIDVKGQ